MAFSDHLVMSEVKIEIDVAEEPEPPSGHPSQKKMAQAYRYGVPCKDYPAPLPAGVNIILFWGGMNCRDLYKTIMLDQEVPDALAEQRQELSFFEEEHMIWPSEAHWIGKTSNGKYFVVHNLEEVRAGPLPPGFCKAFTYGVFVASPNWDTINPKEYRRFLEWVTQNNNTVLASIFHGNPGAIGNLAKGLERLGKLMDLVREMFPSAKLIAVGPTLTYTAWDRSFDQYTQLCQRWEQLVKEKYTTAVISFGSALSGNLFHQLVDGAVVKGDQRSMAGAFYPILLEVLSYLLCSPPIKGASLKDVALLILQETLAIVTERYNDTNRRRLNVYTFEEPIMYNEFRRAVRESRRRRQLVPTTRLFEECARNHFKQREKASAVIDRFHRIGEEPWQLCDAFSFEYRQRRIAALVNEPPVVEPPVLLTAGEELEAPMMQEMMENIVNEEPPQVVEPPVLLTVDEELEVASPTMQEMMEMFTEYGSELFGDPLMSSAMVEEPAQQTELPVQEPEEAAQEAGSFKKEEEEEEEKTFAELLPMQQELYQHLLNEHQQFYGQQQQQQISTNLAVHKEEQPSTTTPAVQTTTTPAVHVEDQASTTTPAEEEEEATKMILRSATKRRIAVVEEEEEELKKKKL